MEAAALYAFAKSRIGGAFASFTSLFLATCLQHKLYEASSAFTPENLLREARRQKRLPTIPVPEVCILDPDGDIVRNLRTARRASRHSGWACYHTELYVFHQRCAMKVQAITTRHHQVGFV